MSFKVLSIQPFEKQLKRLAKKYPSIKKDYAALINSLAKTPLQGTPIGSGCYKVRLTIASKGKGKSGGARVITYIQITQTSVYLLAIYDKSEQDSISDKDIKELLKFIVR